MVRHTCPVNTGRTAPVSSEPRPAIFSAIFRVVPPGKTASLRASICSGSDNSFQLQLISAGSI
jgi:hypothetical protein